MTAFYDRLDALVDADPIALRDLAWAEIQRLTGLVSTTRDELNGVRGTNVLIGQKSNGLQDKVAELEATIDDLRAAPPAVLQSREEADLRAQVVSLTAERDASEIHLGAYETEVFNLNRTIDKLAEEMAEVRRQRDQAEAKVAQRGERLDRIEAVLAPWAACAQNERDTALRPELCQHDLELLAAAEALISPRPATTGSGTSS